MHILDVVFSITVHQLTFAFRLLHLAILLLVKIRPLTLDLPRTLLSPGGELGYLLVDIA